MKRVIADFDDVLCNTTSQWFRSQGRNNPIVFWQRHFWNLRHNPDMIDIQYVKGDCYDDMEVNNLCHHLIELAEEKVIELIVVSSGWEQTDPSKQRLFNRTFPSFVSSHIVSPQGKRFADKGDYIKNVLNIDKIDMFIDDNVNNHRDIFDNGIFCDRIVAPLAPFTVAHSIRSSTDKMLEHYIPLEFHDTDFKRIMQF